MTQKQSEINTELIIEILQTHWLPTKPIGCFTENLNHILVAGAYDRYGIPLTAQKHTSPASWSSPRLVMVGVNLDF